MSFKRRLNSGTHQSYQVLSRSNITRSKHYQNYNYYYYYYGGHQESEGWTQDLTWWIYVYQEVCPEDSRQMGMFQSCCILVQGCHHHWPWDEDCDQFYPSHTWSTWYCCPSYQAMYYHEGTCWKFPWNPHTASHRYNLWRTYRSPCRTRQPRDYQAVLHRERTKHLPKNTNSVGDLVLEDEWTKTSDGDQFMIYDNGVDSSNRMLVWWGTASPCEFHYLVPGWDIQRCSITIHSTLCDSCTPQRLFCHLCLRVPDQQEPVDIWGVPLCHTGSVRHPRIPGWPDYCHHELWVSSYEGCDINLRTPGQDPWLLLPSDAEYMEESTEYGPYHSLPWGGGCQALLWHAWWSGLSTTWWIKLYVKIFVFIFVF